MWPGTCQIGEARWLVSPRNPPIAAAQELGLKCTPPLLASCVDAGESNLGPHD